MKNTVWIVMSIANAYDQPEKAFEELFWHKPTLGELKKYGFKEEHMERMNKPNKFGDGDVWVEEFNKL